MLFSPENPKTAESDRKDRDRVLEQFAYAVMDGQLGRRLEPSRPECAFDFNEYAGQMTPSETVVVGRAWTDHASVSPVCSQADLDAQLPPSGTCTYRSIHGVLTSEFEDAVAMRGLWSSPQAVFERFGPTKG